MEEIHGGLFYLIFPMMLSSYLKSSKRFCINKAPEYGKIISIGNKFQEGFSCKGSMSPKGLF